ncbi:MAG TPA: hypothetical protein VHW43_12235 [Puia sp.]|nr:hypothetical protein [Puia sp.]
MSRKLIVLSLMFLPVLIHAQGLEKCADVVVLPKELYDSFQTAKANVDRIDREVANDREARDGLLKKYLGCEEQPDVASMVKQFNQSLQAAETDRRPSNEAFFRIEEKVKQFIRAAHGKSVEYRLYDRYGGGKLGSVVTITFTIQDDKVVAIRSSYQLPETVAP